MMMKSSRLVVFFGALCAAVLMTAAPGWSGILGSRHDMTATGNPYLGSLGALAKFGSCAACHVPHGAGAERLFPKAPTGLAGGFFGGLCGSCHTNSGFPTGTAAVWAQNSVYAASAHGLDITTAVINPYNLASTGTDYTMTSTSLVYRGSGQGAGQSPRTPPVDAIECLTCHDVHNQRNNRPFLMVTLDVLCETCHTARVNNALATTGYTNNVTGGGSTHPSGALFTGDLNDTSGVANNGAIGNSRIVLGALIMTNPDVAPAGSTWTDATWNSGGHLEGGGVGCSTCHNVHWDDNALITGNTTAYLGITGDNSGGVGNTFCEYCHQGGAVSGGGWWWNPGTATAGYYSHPNDDVASTVMNGAPGIPLGLYAPTSARVGSGGSGLVCTGCHGLHRGSAGAPETETNTPILLNYNNTTYDTVCDACHGGGGALGFNHHPTGATVYATSGNTAGNVSCNGGDTEGYQTCHGGGTNGGGAHNRQSPLGGGVNTNFSQMCVRCHTVNPSIYDGAPAYTANGAASHFVGNTTTATWDGGQAGRSTGTGATIRSAGVDAGTGTWTGSNLPSKWGSTTGVIICESCHRLRLGALMTGSGGTRMMIEISGSARSTVSSTSVAGAAQYTGATYLCTGCHLVPSGTHPLLNATGSVYPIVGGAGHSYTTTGNINCESCHSAHDADTDTGSYILDGGAVGGGVTGMEVDPSLNYTAFCAVCHGAFD